MEKNVFAKSASGRNGSRIKKRVRQPWSYYIRYLVPVLCCLQSKYLRSAFDRNYFVDGDNIYMTTSKYLKKQARIKRNF
jgi:hypothetical protein